MANEAEKGHKKHNKSPIEIKNNQREAEKKHSFFSNENKNEIKPYTLRVVVPIVCPSIKTHTMAKSAMNRRGGATNEQQT